MWEGGLLVEGPFLGLVALFWRKRHADHLTNENDSNEMTHTSAETLHCWWPTGTLDWSPFFVFFLCCPTQPRKTKHRFSFQRPSSTSNELGLEMKCLRKWNVCANETGIAGIAEIEPNTKKQVESMSKISSGNTSLRRKGFSFLCLKFSFFHFWSTPLFPNCSIKWLPTA